MEIIDHVKRALGPVPRKFGWWERFIGWGVVEPKWAESDDLHRWFSGFRELGRSGRVTWGRVVQVNCQLYSTGTHDLPGEVIFTEGDDSYSTPKLLEPIAEKLFRLKGTTPEDPDELRVANHLTSEITRAFRMKVPRSISGGSSCRLSTVVFCRDHLPNKILSLPYFPLLVSQAGDGLAAVVPSKYWPEHFRLLWKLAEEEKTAQQGAYRQTR